MKIRKTTPIHLIEDRINKGEIIIEVRIDFWSTQFIIYAKDLENLLSKFKKLTKFAKGSVSFHNSENDKWTRIETLYSICRFTTNKVTGEINETAIKRFYKIQEEIKRVIPEAFVEIFNEKFRCCGTDVNKFKLTF